MLKHMPWEWELLESSMSDNSSTWRAKVIGGWIVKEEVYNHDDLETPINSSMVFLPDRDHEWVIKEQTVPQEVEQSNLAKDFEC